MRIKLTKIGNSYGVRLPKSVIQECGFQSELELEVRGKRAILSPIVSLRLNWSEACQNDLIVKPALKKGEWQW